MSSLCRKSPGRVVASTQRRLYDLGMPTFGIPLVLVVDDDVVLRETARMLLEEAGYAAEVADGGRAALERLRLEPRPSLVLLDLEMPDVDGFAVLREMERQGALAETAVIAMTATDSSVSTSTLEYALLRKPFGFAALMREVMLACPREWDPEEPPTNEDVEPPTVRAAQTVPDS
jgi:CheY-like chemotaxis protein